MRCVTWSILRPHCWVEWPVLAVLWLVQCSLLNDVNGTGLSETALRYCISPPLFRPWIMSWHRMSGETDAVGNRIRRDIQSLFCVPWTGIPGLLHSYLPAGVKSAESETSWASGMIPCAISAYSPLCWRRSAAAPQCIWQPAVLISRFRCVWGRLLWSNMQSMAHILIYKIKWKNMER